MLVSACHSGIHVVHVVTNTRWQTSNRFHALERSRTLGLRFLQKI